MPEQVFHAMEVTLNDLMAGVFYSVALGFLLTSKKIGDVTPDEVRASQDVIDAYLGVAHD